MGNLYRRGPVWWGRVQRAGREYRRSLRTTARAEASARFRAWVAELDRGVFYGESRHTWKEAVVRFGREVLPRTVKPGTAARYLTSLRQLDAILGGLWLYQINRRAIADMIAQRQGQGATNATIRRDLTAMSAVLTACSAWGWVEENVARIFDRRIIRERRDPITPPSDRDLELVLAAANPDIRPLIQFAADTGMRQEEIASLDWRQVDAERGEITLIATKTGRPRTIALKTIVADAAGTITGTPEKARRGYVFGHGKPRERYQTVPGKFRRVVARARSQALKNGHSFRAFRFHDLRHRFAIEWLKRGGDIYALSRHLGHSSVKTTEMYLGYIRDRGGTGTGS